MEFLQRKNGRKKSVTGKIEINIRQRGRDYFNRTKEPDKKKLKKKKAAGEYEVKNKAWLYCTDKTQRLDLEAKHRLLEIIQRIWRGEGFPKKERKV